MAIIPETTTRIINQTRKNIKTYLSKNPILTDIVAGQDSWLFDDEEHGGWFFYPKLKTRTIDQGFGLNTSSASFILESEAGTIDPVNWQNFAFSFSGNFTDRRHIFTCVCDETNPNNREILFLGVLTNTSYSLDDENWGEFQAIGMDEILNIFPIYLKYFYKADETEGSTTNQEISFNPKGRGNKIVSPSETSNFKYIFDESAINAYPDDANNNSWATVNYNLYDTFWSSKNIISYLMGIIDDLVLTYNFLDLIWIKIDQPTAEELEEDPEAEATPNYEESYIPNDETFNTRLGKTTFPSIENVFGDSIWETLNDVCINTGDFKPMITYVDDGGTNETLFPRAQINIINRQITQNGRTLKWHQSDTDNISNEPGDILSGNIAVDTSNVKGSVYVYGEPKRIEYAFTLTNPFDTGYIIGDWTASEKTTFDAYTTRDQVTDATKNVYQRFKILPTSDFWTDSTSSQTHTTDGTAAFRNLLKDRIVGQSSNVFKLEPAMIWLYNPTTAKWYTAEEAKMNVSPIKQTESGQREMVLWISTTFAQRKDILKTSGSKIVVAFDIELLEWLNSSADNNVATKYNQPIYIKGEQAMWKKTILSYDGLANPNVSPTTNTIQFNQTEKLTALASTEANKRKKPKTTGEITLMDFDYTINGKFINRINKGNKYIYVNSIISGVTFDIHNQTTSIKLESIQ